MSNQVTCPKCSYQFDVEEVLTEAAEKRVRAKITQEVTSQLTQKQQQQQAQLKKQLEEKYHEQNQTAMTEAAEREKLLAQKLQTRDDALTKMRQEALTLQQQKDNWELEKQNLLLENKKALAAEREKIILVESKKAQEENKLERAELEKKLTDALKVNEDLSRKLKQGSQQLQGEVLELELENSLRSQFTQDLIEPIGKGITGADIRQRVVNRNGQPCGIILWESKRTKNWASSWVSKLKEDLRSEKADLAVLVTTAMPKDATSGSVFYQGVWLVTPEQALILATALRFNLIKTSHLLSSQISKDERLEGVYRYLTGPEFVSQIEKMLETFTAMKAELDKERRVFKRMWEEREQQINRLSESTATVYGGFQAVTQRALPTVKQLDFE